MLRTNSLRRNRNTPGGIPLKCHASFFLQMPSIDQQKNFHPESQNRGCVSRILHPAQDDSYSLPLQKFRSTRRCVPPFASYDYTSSRIIEEISIVSICKISDRWSALRGSSQTKNRCYQVVFENYRC